MHVHVHEHADQTCSHMYVADPVYVCNEEFRPHKIIVVCFSFIIDITIASALKSC